MSDINLLCAKCGSHVSRQEGLVSDGYFAYCEECDEDLYSIETHEEKKKEFIVYITQEYEPIVVKAVDRDDALDQVENHMSWGEPIDVEITVEENEIENA